MNDTTTGAQMIMRCLEQEGVERIFGYSGGAIMPVFDALYDSPIEFVLSRHEQGAMHMADGFARSSGRVGVAMVTSGPGATNCITGLMTAMMDSVPLVLMTGQVQQQLLGKDAFQEADVTGITYAVTKHSYLIKDPRDLPRVMREAFFIARSGRPGPVVIDLPKDVTMGPCDAPIPEAVDLPGYHLPRLPAASDLQAAADLLAHSQRPVLCLGQGVVLADAGEAVVALADRLQAPMVTTLLGKGGVPERHPMHMGMLGMHGEVSANFAVAHCDMIMSIGSRWDDRITGRLEEFCPAARKIHLDIDEAEFGKIIQPDVKLLGDARVGVEALLPLVAEGHTDNWWQDLSAWRKAHPLKTGKHGGLRISLILERLDALTAGEDVYVTDVGQHQMWAAQFLRVARNRHWISSGGAGTMGFGLPAAIGAQFARPDERVWAVCGDGGFQMTMTELTTAALHKLPLKILLSENHYLGMVRQWQEMFFANRLSGVDLEGNPDFVKLAAAIGVQAWPLKRPADVDKILTRAMDHTDGPCMIVAEVLKDDNVFPMVPPGAAVSQILTGKDRWAARKS